MHVLAAAQFRFLYAFFLELMICVAIMKAALRLEKLAMPFPAIS
jgi:hypothetical protein